MINDTFTQFVTLWAVIDPIGTVPVFITVTSKHKPEERKQIAVRAAITATGILLFFLVCGQLLLEGMGVSLSAFQIAGGLVLFLFALSMIFGETKPEEEVRIANSVEDTAVFPLAVPSLASPGAMLAIVLLTDNHTFSLAAQATTAGIMILIMACALVLMLFAAKIQTLIGTSGSAIISRVMGLILASVAVDAVLEGIIRGFNLQAAG